ncbi:nitrilase and fragile histidine triad fusion protein NitFhit [Glossina fuscipes]|uniref:Nitrilase and fragile histidine triad fusion protein NitFhit n=1 Tax=Glossina fuscipes TaxID=7396 RepID=A0A9C5Z275_9MUSC|nr:nitrilase and fragile histidine triad fusion protein NitFhit [Glossina fuscipes]
MLIQRYLITSVCKLKHSYLRKLNHRNLEVRKMSSRTKQKPVVAVTQMCTTNDKAANMRQVEQLIGMAKAQSAEFIFLPECCDFVGENRKQTLELSEPLTGPTMEQYQALAKKHDVWLSLGGLHESILDQYERKTDKIHNAHVILNNRGELVAVYRKLHLFDVDTPEFTFQESKVVCGGQRLIAPLDTPIGKLALQICYDMRFPESSILLRRAGAELLTYPSAFTFYTGKAHWEILLRSRAIETQCFVLAAAQVGHHNAKRKSWGHALIVDPWGKILANLGERKLDVATVEIDLDSLEPIRCRMPCFKHRRDDVYSLVAYGEGTTEPQQDYMFAENCIKKQTIFFESPYSYAFTNICCVVEGHVLVSTKRIVARLKDLNSVEISDLFTVTCRIQRMLENFYKTSASTVNVQDGPLAGQTVPHVHFHVMPRRVGDFERNDDVYRKLDATAGKKVERTIEERIKEAQSYREALRTMKQ